MIRLWQDPMDDMYICTHGEIEQLPNIRDEDLYRCTPTLWCETTDEALHSLALIGGSTSTRELGAYRLLAQAETLEELKLIQLLEDL